MLCSGITEKKTAPVFFTGELEIFFSLRQYVSNNSYIIAALLFAHFAPQV